MSRLIDGDALYKELNAIRKEEVLLHGRSNNKDCCTLSTALYEIEHAPTIEPEPKWIPCSERLPEYNEAVLTWDGGTFCIEKRIPYIRDDDGEPIESDWWVGDEYDEYESDYYPNLRDGAAIAWMPLPEPWKEGEK